MRFKSQSDLQNYAPCKCGDFVFKRTIYLLVMQNARSKNKNKNGLSGNKLITFRNNQSV